MDITISNRLYVYDYTQAAYAWCKENLVLPNPDYFKKEKMGKWTGNTPKEIVLFEKIGSAALWLPFGCIYRFMKAFPNTPYKAEFCPLERFYYNSSVNPYEYQEKAIQAVLRRKNGVLVAPCGSGKTIMGLEIVARIGGRALWLTHTQDLLNQSMTRAKSVLGNIGQGTITEGKVNCGDGITFATVQTLSKIDLTEHRDYWDVIICDECHHAAGSPTKVTQFYKVLSNLKARYKIGLTATPKRADGLEESMFALLGDIIYEVKKEDVAYTTCPVKVQTVQTGYVPDYDMILLGDGTINYMELINQLVTDESRFRFVLDYINELTGTMIVFGNRVDYLKKLSEEFKGRSVCLSGMGQSKAAKNERKDALEKLNAGELDAVFATYQLGREGLDCPSLQYVVFATPEKDESTVQQASGRVARKAEGKEYGTIIDFVDNFGMYKGWAKKRTTVYKKLGYKC